MMALGKTVRALREARGWKLVELAERSGVDVGTISALEVRDSKRSQYAAQLAQALGVRIEDLTGGAEHPIVPLSAVDNYNISDVIEVRVGGSVKTQFGEAHVGRQGYEGPVFFHAKWLQDRNLDCLKFFGFTMYGQGMEPTLYDGDIVFLNSVDTEPADGKVFVIGMVDVATQTIEGVVKRLMKRRGVWYMISDNPDQVRYPTERLPPIAKKLSEILSGDGCVIIGQVIYRQTERL